MSKQPEAPDELDEILTEVLGLEFQDGEWRLITYDENGDPVEFVSYAEEVAIAKSALLAREERIAKAYGGCTNCYGKGYATTNQYATGGGQKWQISGPMEYCKCERGMQLEKLIAQLTNPIEKEKKT